MKIAYLCGGINGLADAEASGWREVAKAAFRDRLFVLDPMRRDYRGREDENVAAIVAGDLADIDKADVLLVNAARPSWGTAMEVFYAASQGNRVTNDGYVSRLLIVAVVPAGSPVSPWLRHHCDEIVPTLEAGIAVVLEKCGE